MHIPLDIEYAVAIAGLELVCNRTGTLMYLNLIFVVDIAQRIVARDGVTAAHELVLLEVLLADVNRLFAIELVGHHKQLLLVRLLLFLLAANEWHELTPTRTAVFFLVLAVQLVDILLAQQYYLLAQSLEELGALAVLVVIGQFIGECCCGFEVVLLQECVKYFLTLALRLAVVAAQYGLNLGLSLSGRYKVDPTFIDVLRLGCENLYLVATLQFVAQRNQLVVNLSTDTMTAQEGVDGECKVECRTACRQSTDLALRRKHEYLTGKQVELDGVQEVHSIRLWVVQNLLDGAQPLVELVLVLGIFLLNTVLVFPVSCKSLFGNLVHTVGTYLHLNPLTCLRHQCNVQCLIAVGLRLREPVAQTVGVALVYL